jgi:hypothetical protein
MLAITSTSSNPGIPGFLFFGLKRPQHVAERSSASLCHDRLPPIYVFMQAATRHVSELQMKIICGPCSETFKKNVPNLTSCGSDGTVVLLSLHVSVV